MISSAQSKLIQRYLDFDLSDSELDAFEEALIQSEAMRDQLAFELAIRERATISATSTEKQRELEDQKSVSRQQSVIRSFVSIPSAAAAVVIPLIGLAVLLHYVFSPGKTISVGDAARSAVSDMDNIAESSGADTVGITPTPSGQRSKQELQLDTLFNAHFSYPPAPSDPPIYLAEAFADYERRTFEPLWQFTENSIPEVRSVSTSNARFLLLFYQGISYLGTGNAALALERLREAERLAATSEEKRSVYDYLGLTAIKMKQLDAARRYLAQGGPKSKSILKKIQE